MPEIWEWHSIPICHWETRNIHFQNSLLPSSQHWTHLSLLRTRTYETTSACLGYITHCLLLQPPKWTVSSGSRETTMRLKSLCSCHTDLIEMRPYVTPMPLELNWLSVKRSITFKALLLTFKCLHGLAPPYLSVLLSPYCPTCRLYSTDQLLLKQPTSWTKIGERSFSCAAPRAWIQLPLTVRQGMSVHSRRIFSQIIILTIDDRN